MAGIGAPRPDPVLHAWEGFVNRNVMPGPKVKEGILASWLRCRSYGVNPYGGTGPVVDEPVLRAKIEANRQFISIARPFMEDLYRVAGAGFIVVLTDDEPVLLEVVGDPAVSRRAGELNFVPGARWNEQAVGTNAIGTALAIDAPMQVCGAEHYCSLHHPWTCSAAPVHDQAGRFIGVLDMTGPCELVHPHTLGMVMAAARAIENQLRWEAAVREVEISNRAFRATFSSISEGVLSVDSGGVVKQVNAAAARLLGRSETDILGRPIISFFDESNPVARSLLQRREYADQEALVVTPAGKVYCTSSARAIMGSEASAPGMVMTLREAKGVHRLVHKIAGHKATFSFDDLVYCSDAVKSAVTLARHAAATPLNILITGETGTGKEMVAQAIHNASQRARGPFVALNCGAIPRELIESELFGYEGGAFTGARREGRPGKFELADGGTVFLDEIAEMPLEMQVKLLRVVQERKVARLGSHDETPVDVRLIAATNVDLAEAAARGDFRKDLFFRLNVMPIRMPALRERPEDIAVLTNHFLKDLTGRLGKRALELEAGVMEILLAYTWPGNVRELENTLERAACLANDVIRMEHLPDPLRVAASGKETSKAQGITGPDEGLRLKAVEKEVIMDALDKSGGNISRAARTLGIGRNTLYRRLRDWGVNTQQAQGR
ncbi:MAG: sigma-54-dependent Fis family transcriptional regulator [Firmicutes bacterium]|nr:sigma-54-dependent Fis family transcriptional regulator [Bacillota bacterium]